MKNPRLKSGEDFVRVLRTYHAPLVVIEHYRRHKLWGGWVWKNPDTNLLLAAAWLKGVGIVTDHIYSNVCNLHRAPLPIDAVESLYLLVRAKHPQAQEMTERQREKVKRVVAKRFGKEITLHDGFAANIEYNFCSSNLIVLRMAGFYRVIVNNKVANFNDGTIIVYYSDKLSVGRLYEKLSAWWGQHIAYKMLTEGNPRITGELLVWMLTADTRGNES